MTPWFGSLYTGLFTSFVRLTLRPHDPQLALFSGTTAPWSGVAQELSGSSIGWDAEAAEGACVGEAIERLQANALADDQVMRARFADWPLDEPAVPPERWVLFHPEQYRQAGFPFEPLTPRTECAWVCCRQALSGAPWWVPADFVFLNAGVRHVHRICPGLSTGLACGRTGDPLVLRGLQEVIERDAVVGAWWRRYALDEFPIAVILNGLGEDAAARIERPNLTYRCYRIASPFSAHVTIVTVAGVDREGWCFSVGAACRETAAASWTKSLLEAIHGRYYVRYLKQELAAALPRGAGPSSFRDHAVWYTIQPRLLELTMLGQVQPFGREPFPAGQETVASLVERLGPERPVLFRSLTPPALAAEALGWHVLRVVVPGLQPLHGDHLLPHLGGPLWLAARLGGVGRDAATSDALEPVVTMTPIDLHRLTELDRTTWPDVRDQIVNFTHEGEIGEPRSYPGYPCWPLARCGTRPWPSLEKILCSRRSATKLTTMLPARATMSRLLQFSHGVCAQDGRGPTPSAGGLQALELYLVNFSADWLPAGTYHYQRGAHSLAQLVEGADREAWRTIVPSLELMEGGVLLWIIVGDGARVRQKYGSRSGRFLLLEAGHLMQNLCLMSQRVGWTTVPLGGFFEQDIARRMALPADDAVLYLGVFGKIF